MGSCAFFGKKAKIKETWGGERRDRERLPANTTILKNAKLTFDASVPEFIAKQITPSKVKYTKQERDTKQIKCTEQVK